MDRQNTFFESILNYLTSETSGALMISGAWGLGKTYYINNVLINQQLGLNINIFILQQKTYFLQ